MLYKHCGGRPCVCLFAGLLNLFKQLLCTLRNRECQTQTTAGKLRALVLWLYPESLPKMGVTRSFSFKLE